MCLKIIPTLLLFIFISGYAYANNGDEFKNICSVIAKDFAELVSLDFENSDNVPADLEKRAEENFILQMQKLRVFVLLNPDSIWTDDARYILTTTKAGYPDQEANELEYLLEKYPNMHTEEWTKINLPWFVPGNLPLTVRVQLLVYYKESGKKDKLKALYEESIKKFPGKEQFLKKIIDFKND